MTSTRKRHHAIMPHYPHAAMAVPIRKYAEALPGRPHALALRVCACALRVRARLRLPAACEYARASQRAACSVHVGRTLHARRRRTCIASSVLHSTLLLCSRAIAAA